LGSDDKVLLDTRYPASAGSTAARIVGVSPGLFGRALGEFRLWRLARDADLVLCLNGMPPLGRMPARTAVFLQNKLLIDSEAHRNWQLGLRRRVLRFGIRNTDIAIVQTESMARLARATGFKNVLVAPVFEWLPAQPAVTARPQCDFFYPADGLPHKNHARLFAAWERLARSGLRPHLGVTLADAYADVWRLAQPAIAAGARITNYGWISREETLALLSNARALVFPSHEESFGLPLVEAQMLNRPIIASELDYVRDVARPSQTFDPNSDVSIARAVRRFLGEAEDLHAADAPAAWLRKVVGYSKTI
jgi:glycosyltransferase involved in cell wall biosynthesis